MSHWTNELDALKSGAIARIGSARFRRKLLSDGRVFGTLSPSPEERLQTAADGERFVSWRTAAGTLLRRHAAESTSRFQELADELATFVALTHESEISEPEGRWRACWIERVHQIAGELAGILARGLPPPAPRSRGTSPLFALTVTPRAGSWRLRARSPAGEAVDEVVAPSIAPLAWPFRREATIACGRALFEAAFPPPIAALFHATLIRGDGGARIRVRSDGEARHLPWELLHDGRAFLALSARTPVSRGLRTAPHASSIALLPARRKRVGNEVAPPLRVLVTTGAGEAADLEVTTELRLLRDTLAPWTSRGLLRLDLAADGTLNGIRRLLRSAVDAGRPYHVWHFIGHGEERSTTGATELILPLDGEGRHRVGAALLRTLFRDHPELQMVVLNCCLAGRTVAGGSAASAFLESGVRAVVAMLHEISDGAALLFAEELYGSLVDGAALENAVAEARRAISLTLYAHEWLIPAVYIRSSPPSLAT
ncbi:MAG TPA: CHAT domain-containing protein [Thermoanaerobaculia bacterium]|nr:CHAT domain-containing protein [Thermoanaerobaculia bacterium]